MDETNPMLSVMCELCGVKVRRGWVGEHERVVHRWDKRVAVIATNFDDCYDEASLRLRLGQALRARISIERREDWGLSMVPTIRAEGPWSDDHGDAYWRAFARFCSRPVWKEHARLEAYDSDPALGRWEATRLTLFYRSDLRRLSIASEVRDQSQTQRAVISDVPLRHLCGLRTLSEALQMGERSQKPPRGQP